MNNIKEGYSITVRRGDKNTYQKLNREDDLHRFLCRSFLISSRSLCVRSSLYLLVSSVCIQDLLYVFQVCLCRILRIYCLVVLCRPSEGHHSQSIVFLIFKLSVGSVNQHELYIESAIQYDPILKKCCPLLDPKCRECHSMRRLNHPL